MATTTRERIELLGNLLSRANHLNVKLHCYKNAQCGGHVSCTLEVVGSNQKKCFRLQQNTTAFLRPLPHREQGHHNKDHQVNVV
jgi:hypothetical protein